MSAYEGDFFNLCIHIVFLAVRGEEVGVTIMSGVDVLSFGRVFVIFRHWSYLGLSVGKLLQFLLGFRLVFVGIFVVVRPSAFVLLY